MYINYNKWNKSLTKLLQIVQRMLFANTKNSSQGSIEITRNKPFNN